jgi:hypothetical protein
MDLAGTDKSTDQPRRFGMEHRWGQRVDCHLCVGISAAGGGGGGGRLRNVSMSGAFIETRLALPIFARIEIAVLQAGPAQREIVVTANVVRSMSDGVGVEWSEASAGSICALLGCTTRCAAAGVSGLLPTTRLCATRETPGA